MRVAAEIAVYSLAGQTGAAVCRFLEIVDRHPVARTTHAMSTVVTGSLDDVTVVLREGFAALAAGDQIVMRCVISNAGPGAAPASPPAAATAR